jgi:hypothetical protein
MTLRAAQTRDGAIVFLVVGRLRTRNYLIGGYYIGSYYSSQETAQVGQKAARIVKRAIPTCMALNCTSRLHTIVVPLLCLHVPAQPPRCTVLSPELSIGRSCSSSSVELSILRTSSGLGQTPTRQHEAVSGVPHLLDVNLFKYLLLSLTLLKFGLASENTRPKRSISIRVQWRALCIHAKAAVRRAWRLF